jgi:CRISPR-associated protein Csy3
MAAKKTKKTNENNASVLAFERRISSSDAIFFGVDWNKRNEIIGRPLPVQEKTIRGVTEFRLKSQNQTQTKVDADVGSTNIQTVDYCNLGLDEDTLRVQLNLQIVGEIEPCACNNPIVARKISEMVNKFNEEKGFKELCRRYAINLANGRFLWRNRLGAEAIEVKISVGENKEFVFDALEISVKNFSYQNEDLEYICKEMFKVFSGEISHLNIKVDTCIRRFSGMEVYPSQDLVTIDKSTKTKKAGRKTKYLFSTIFNGDPVAALHPQKVTNAIHTIDTWYEYGNDATPISINAYGAVTNKDDRNRMPYKNNDFYTLFDTALIEGWEKITKDEQLYVMAMLIRGGVFGGNGKEKE